MTNADWKIERTGNDWDRGTLRLVATAEEARDELIDWAERGIPGGTRWEVVSLIVVKAVAWLCVKQMERDRKEKVRYGR